jgi:accessory gene regulator B
LTPNLTRSFAAYLRDQLDLTAEQEDVALFGLRTLVYTPITLFFTFLFAWSLGCLWATIWASISAFALRHYSHGAHNNTPLTCMIKSIVVYTALGEIAQFSAPYLTRPVMLLVTGAGFLLTLPAVWRCAPADSPAKPVTDLKDRRWLRLASIIMTCAIVVAQIILIFTLPAFTAVLAVGLGLWWQAFTLTGSGHRFVTLFDNLSFRKEGESNETFSH